MAGRYKKYRDGQIVKVKGIAVPYTYWPDSFITRGRTVTTNPWSCMSAHVNMTIEPANKRKRALAFIEQAEDFYRAAANAPRAGSQPLLYYYSFLNLAKAFLVVKTNVSLSRCFHGLKEPPDNIRKRLTITSQQVRVDGHGGGRVKVYRELTKQIGFRAPSSVKDTKLVDLLEQTVAIHPTVCHTLNKKKRFFALRTIEFRTANKEVWIRLNVDKNELAIDKDAPGLIRNQMLSFEEVESDDRETRCYESEAMKYRVSPREILPKLVESTKKDVWSVLRPGGYRYYISTIEKNARLAQVSSAYQVMFYFGSIARYRPDDFIKFIEGKHGWLVTEFINTQPIQFTYLLGSSIIDSEMVIPETSM